MVNTIGDYLIYVISFVGLFSAIYFFWTLYEHKEKIKTPKFKRYPKVTILIPAYNEEMTIFKTVQSILRLDYPKDKLEVIVINDASKDKTLTIVSKIKDERLKVFTNPKNMGKGESLNFGLKKAKGELVGVIDADSFVRRDGLKKVIGFFENKKVMAVTPSMSVYRPKNILQHIQRMEYMTGIYLRKVFAMLGSIHVIPGPFSIFRKSFFKKHGGYDTSTITEDTEIALRLQSHDYIIENSLDAHVYTVTPHKFRDLLKQRLRWYSGFLQNIWKYRKMVFSKNHGNLSLLILPLAFASVILSLVAILYLFWKTIENTYQTIIRMLAIDFDITKMFRLNTDPFFINLSPIIMLSLLTLVFGIIIIWIARTFSEEKQTITFSYVLFLSFYSLFFAFWWGLTILSKIFKKRLIWGEKSF